MRSLAFREWEISLLLCGFLFKDQAERYGNQSRSGHRPVPGTVSTGIATETVTAGGEVEFVRRMIADSLKLKDSVR